MVFSNGEISDEPVDPIYPESKEESDEETLEVIIESTDKGLTEIEEVMIDIVLWNSMQAHLLFSLLLYLIDYVLLMTICAQKPKSR